MATQTIVPNERDVQQLDRNTNDTATLVAQAQLSDAADRTLTIWQAVKKYKKAVFWSTLLSTALVMEGYDIVIVCIVLELLLLCYRMRSDCSLLLRSTDSSASQGSYQYSTIDTILDGSDQEDRFQERFGTLNPETKEYEISAAWQSGLSNSALVGELFGLGMNFFATDRFGCRRTYMFFMAWLTCTIFISVFAPSLPVLALGEALSGISWGVFQTLTTGYACEIVPPVLRPFVRASGILLRAVDDADIHSGHWLCVARMGFWYPTLLGRPACCGTTSWAMGLATALHIAMDLAYTSDDWCILCAGVALERCAAEPK
jgi:SP family general alpha glucoside:H+ symporter-like MFS transporter